MLSSVSFNVQLSLYSNRMIKFTCTDRLGETKTIEKALEADSDIKKYNNALIQSLKQFQPDANSLMTEFVNNEKKALEEKRLSNDHLKQLISKKNDDDDDEESDNEDKADETDSNTQAAVKRPDLESPVETARSEKKLCV